MYFRLKTVQSVHNLNKGMAYSKQPSTKRNQEPNVRPVEVSERPLMLLGFMIDQTLT